MTEQQKDMLIEIGNVAYRAVIGKLEAWEAERKILGNGHHAAQGIAKLAQEALARRLN